jgi:hypothetical protein
MLADEAQQIEIFLGGLLDELFEHVRPGPQRRRQA